MEYSYGKFTPEQIKDAKKLVHSMVHWLLLYAEQDYDKEKFGQYFKTVLYRIGGMGELFGETGDFVLLMGTLESASLLEQEEDLNFRDFRKLILDAHTLIDECFRRWDDESA